MPGTFSFHPAINLRSAPSTGHLAVDDESVERLLPQSRLDFFCVHQRNHLCASAGQHVALELEHCLFVLNQQHLALEISDLPSRRCGARLSGRRFSAGRQSDFEHRSALRRVVRGDVAAMFLDDAVADAESEAGSLTHALGGVERIEDAVGVLDAWSGVVKFRVTCPSLV